MICAVCRRRKARNFGWFNPVFNVGDQRREASRRWVCSLTCLSEAKPMTAPNDSLLTPIDQDRLCAAAGQYIESVGKTDLMQWSREEFVDLLEVIVAAWQDNAHSEALDQDLDDDIPY
jgi:hypothetical protein